MTTYRYIFGPVPSRRMGLSLGISPIPEGTCNYSCIYCQLGRTRHMTAERKSFVPVDAMAEELSAWLKSGRQVDVITVVGEGDPTLAKDLGLLAERVKSMTPVPVAIITNGALLADPEVREELMAYDIVLPSFDAADAETFQTLNRPHGSINYQEVYQGLVTFSKAFSGQLWIETMLVKGVNDSEEQLCALKAALDSVDYDRLFINTPVRPPAEEDVQEPDPEIVKRAVEILGGTAINHLVSNGFFSEITDDFEAVLSIIKRHPMNQYEIRSFLLERESDGIEEVFERLAAEKSVSIIDYKGYLTYRG